MKKIAQFFLVIPLLFLVSLAFASGLDVQVDGTTVGGSFAAQLNFTGDVSGSGAGSTKTIVIAPAAAFTTEVVTASAETVTSADSPRTFIFTQSSGLTTAVTLPTAASGLQYRFVDGGGAQKTINIDPASTLDTIEFLALGGGDKLSSTAATGDSVYLIGATNKWYVAGMGAAAWTDGGI